MALRHLALTHFADIVFLRAWYAILPRKFYNPVTSLLLSPSGDGGTRDWRGMRLTGAVRRDERIKTPGRNVDSIYKPITERPLNRKFNALKVPRKLQAALVSASATLHALTGANPSPLSRTRRRPRCSRR